MVNKLRAVPPYIGEGTKNINQISIDFSVNFILKYL